ncbi:MAG: alpha/beta hydrolase [Elusimicrobiaceae bacterium]|nr:alpha/beta hydrolase [Elusimicrobiaceae bacterium]
MLGKKILSSLLLGLCTPGIFTISGYGAAPAYQPVPLVLDTTDIANCDAVVLSVRGLDFTEFGRGVELKNILGIYNFLSGHTRKELKAKVARQYAQMLETDSHYYGDPLYIPRTYLNDFLVKRLPETGKKYAVVSLDWNGDAGQSARHFKQVAFWIEQACAEAAKTGKPVHLVAHSWGTVLSHAALHLLENSKSPVRIDKFITLGSPLSPSAPVLKTAIGIDLAMYGIEAKVAKPGNVGYWINLWAQKDLFSNAIEAADVNIQVDQSAEPYRLALSAYLHGKAARSGAKAVDYSNDLSDPEKTVKKIPADSKQAYADLRKLNSTVIWHGSYFTGVAIKLKSLNEEYHLDSVRRYFLPILQ